MESTESIFRSERPEGKGIAMLRAGVFKGLDQDHGHTGNLEAAEGRVSGYHVSGLFGTGTAVTRD